MRVADVIRATLSGVIGSAIGFGCLEGCLDDCEDADPFDVDYRIYAKTVDELLRDRSSFHEPEDITCEAVCIAELRAPASDFVTVRSCAFDIDGYTSPDSGESDEIRDYTEVGRVQCAGKIQPECAGRRPLGHIEARDVAGDALGRSFALFAHLEAASVVAFVELRRQLTAWGAPRRLIERCDAAAQDEVRHAVMMTRFARAHGASVPVVHRSACTEDLLAVALHNAVEGCVNETWAALVAHVQAMHAQDPDVRAAYTSIAADETRHAQLAWDLHAWFMSRLGDEDRRAVVLAQRQAIAALPHVGWVQAQALPRELGHPEPDLAAAMARDLGHRLVA